MASTQPLLDPEVAAPSKYRAVNLRGAFASSAAVILAVLLGLTAAFVDYAQDFANDFHVQQYYMWYIHVAIMIYIGFGFLMTFLRRYSYSALGFTLVLSAIVQLEAILLVGTMQQVAFGPKLHKIQLDLPLLIDSLFCAAASMITFGALIGKATLTQMLWLLVMQVPIYAINQHLVMVQFGALDIGGSISIHAFGAYFGLAAALVLSPPGASKTTKNAAVYTSDVTAMIGTIFLFIYWPSFNGALASNPNGTFPPGLQPQFYAVVNTIMSLLGAVIAAFIASAAFEGKLDMVHIQNATLAGGVAVGSAANLQIAPAGALAIGIVAGALSTAGYVHLTPLLERKIGLQDTCGIHNLHAIPGMLGGFAATIAARVAYTANEPLLLKGRQQPYYELAAMAVNLGIALTGGFVCAMIVSKVNLGKKALGVDNMFEDGVYWKGVEPEDEFRGHNGNLERLKTGHLESRVWEPIERGE